MASINTRKTSNGEPRYDVRYRMPTGTTRNKTFRRKKDAESFKRNVETELIQGTWIDPSAGKVTLAEYAQTWLDQSRHRLTPRTINLYESQLRCHIAPALGDLPIQALTTPAIRAWHADMANGTKIGPTTVAKVYRLLRTILATAVEDQLIIRNPCIIKGAGREPEVERPMPSAAEMMVLANAVPDDRRLIVLLGGQTGMRRGEILALRRRHVDLLHQSIRVEETVMDLKSDPGTVNAPKSEAGRRTLHLGPCLLQAVEEHLATYVDTDPDAHLFTGVQGGRLRLGTWNRQWSAAREAVGLTRYHFHDLRHLAGTSFAQSGATTKETMRRLGHSTPRAALIYQHATDERDQALAVEHERRMFEAIRVANL